MLLFRQKRLVDSSTFLEDVSVFLVDCGLDRIGGMVAGLELLIATGGETYDMDRDVEFGTGSRCIMG